MFGILISNENLPEIMKHNESLASVLHIDPKTYLDHLSDWYYVRGYVTRAGAMVDYAVLPEFILKRGYEYNPDKIKTDWDIIVRK